MSEAPDPDPRDRDRPARERPLQTYARLSSRQRTVVAAAAMVVMIALGVLLLPFGVDVDGARVECGSPLTPLHTDAEDPAKQACDDVAGVRQVAAGAVVVVTVATSFGVRAWIARQERAEDAEGSEDPAD